jgi:serine/threonine protein phosphatase PrpC
MRRRSAALEPGALPPHIVNLQEERRRKIAEDAAKKEVNEIQEGGTSSTSPRMNSSSSNQANPSNVVRKTSFLDQVTQSAVKGESKTSNSTNSKKDVAAATVIKFRVGVHQDQGVRFTMEDAHSIEPQLDKLRPLAENSPSGVACHDSAFFGVYDGHGGSQAAEYCLEYLPSVLVDSIVARGEEEGDVAVIQDSLIVESFVRSFQTTDQQFLKHCWDNGIGNVGTTVTTVLCHNGVIYCGNAGDSRTVLCRKGKAMNLSHDHKPTDTNEETRIRKVGGFVVMGRVMGKLAVSRAIGDSQFKRKESRMMTEFGITGPLVVPDPDVTCTPIQPGNDEFIILACDGLWDVSTSQEAVTSVKAGLAAGKDPKSVSEDLVNNALRSGSRDNVTAMVVVFERQL